MPTPGFAVLHSSKYPVHWKIYANMHPKIPGPEEWSQKAIQEVAVIWAKNKLNILGYRCYYVMRRTWIQNSTGVKTILLQRRIESIKPRQHPSAVPRESHPRVCRSDFQAGSPRVNTKTRITLIQTIIIPNMFGIMTRQPTKFKIATSCIPQKLSLGSEASEVESVIWNCGYTRNTLPWIHNNGSVRIELNVPFPDFCK